MSRSLYPFIRSFSSSASSSAGRSAAPSEEIQAQRRKGDRQVIVNHIDDIQPFKFNDTTTLGYLRMYKMREAQLLLEKISVDDVVLKRHHRPFVPPTSPLRLSQTINLNDSDAAVNRRRTLIIPVSGLPLKSPESIHRVKLIAGPRWTPGRPGLRETKIESSNEGYNAGPSDLGREGWIKISEDRFESGRMNRKSVSDILDRLITSANDEKSPLSPNIPIDTRHIIARTRRRERENVISPARAAALTQRPNQVGAVMGYPAEWLSPEVKRRADEGKQRISGKVLVA